MAGSAARKWCFRVALLVVGFALLGASLAMRLTPFYNRYIESDIQCFGSVGQPDAQHNGHYVDICLFRDEKEGGTECGQPAADALCEFKGYVWAVSSVQDLTPAGADTMALGNTVSGAPQVFTNVCCDMNSYWPNPPRWLLWSSGIILVYYASYIVTKLFFLAVEILLVGLVATEALYFFDGVEVMLRQLIYTIGMVIWTYQCFNNIWCNVNPKECDPRWLGNPLTLWKVSKCLLAFQVGRFTTLLLGKAFSWAFFFRNQLPQMRRVINQERKLRSLAAPEWAKALIRTHEETKSEEKQLLAPQNRVAGVSYGTSGPGGLVRFESTRVIDYLKQDKNVSGALPSRSKRWTDSYDIDKTPLVASSVSNTALLQGLPTSGNKVAAITTQGSDPGFFEQALQASKLLEDKEGAIAAKHEAKELSSDLVAFTSGVGSLRSFHNFLEKYQDMSDKQLNAECKKLAKRLFENLKNGLLGLQHSNPAAGSSIASSNKEADDKAEDCILFSDFASALKQASSKLAILGVVQTTGSLAETATAAWKMFDKENAKQLKLGDVEETLVEVYKQRRNLACSIRANEAVANSLRSAIGAVVQTIMVFVYLEIFGIAAVLNAGLTYFSAYIVALSFLFRDYFRTVFNNLVYLLGQHPYDVGDEMEFAKDGKWIVKSFDLMYTVLISKNGEWACFQNTYVRQNRPINWTRSNLKKEKFKIRIPSNAPVAELVPSVLKAMKKLYEKKFLQDLDEGGGVKVRISDMPDTQTLVLTAKFKYSNPPPDDSRCKKVKKAMKDIVISTLLEAGVHHIPIKLETRAFKLEKEEDKEEKKDDKAAAAEAAA